MTQIIFHVATMMPMPPGEAETAWVNKKRHIGNDYVTIVFNDSSHDFAFGAGYRRKRGKRDREA